MEHEEQMKRWRLILGEDSEKRFSDMNGGNPLSLTEEQAVMDSALAPKLPAGWGMCGHSLTKIL